jgi:hypothetical protein
MEQLPSGSWRAKVYAGMPFTEHRHVPDLRPDPADPCPEWQHADGRLREAVSSGELADRHWCRGEGQATRDFQQRTGGSW